MRECKSNLDEQAKLVMQSIHGFCVLVRGDYSLCMTCVAIVVAWLITFNNLMAFSHTQKNINLIDMSNIITELIHRYIIILKTIRKLIS